MNVVVMPITLTVIGQSENIYDFYPDLQHSGCQLSIELNCPVVPLSKIFTLCSSIRALNGAIMTLNTRSVNFCRLSWSYPKSRGLTSTCGKPYKSHTSRSQIQEKRLDVLKVVDSL
eukprot:CAMPEP_0118921026 /NCGR_PEP_ID=MMETSP1169-20130426/426_1 /TAXON_ID=36882 /ORGANISM="Pyramimonas obovata, Strain CCMP722" /LENGTH=115 /DNA_ID=CAMNT_0006861673 /DNA_START=454 /DNA_END=801 /DNA_ORIENTATION=-